MMYTQTIHLFNMSVSIYVPVEMMSIFPHLDEAANDLG
jgi:hypothetical protein